MNRSELSRMACAIDDSTINIVVVIIIIIIIWWQYFDDFPDNQLTKFRAFISWARIFIRPLNFYEASDVDVSRQ